MNHDINDTAQCYGAYVNGDIVGFVAVIHMPHDRVRNFKRVHRLVVLPDWQGVGIGVRLMETIGAWYRSNGFRFRITTSTPALVHSLKPPKWVCDRAGRVRQYKSEKGTRGALNKTVAAGRYTYAFELIG